MNRFTKVGADGAKLADDAAEWVAVLDNTTQLRGVFKCRQCSPKGKEV